MAPVTVPLQPVWRHRLFPPGVTGLHLPAMYESAGIPVDGPPGESLTGTLSRLARPLLCPPPEMSLAWHFLDGIQTVWIDGGGSAAVCEERLSEQLGIKVIRDNEGSFAAESGGTGLLEELECERGMVCDLGQSFLKISRDGRRWMFPRDFARLPLYTGMDDHTVEQKGAQRRVLRQFIAGSIRTVLNDSAGGVPTGVIFALPSALDQWGQPAGSSYIGMKMDTQLTVDALELAGLGGVRHWVLNDAELAAMSAIFDERVAARGGKALVFTVGTGIGVALADPMAAALHFAMV